MNFHSSGAVNVTNGVGDEIGLFDLWIAERLIHNEADRIYAEQVRAANMARMQAAESSASRQIATPEPRKLVLAAPGTNIDQ